MQPDNLDIGVERQELFHQTIWLILRLVHRHTLELVLVLCALRW
jgi:hypothetical protein